MQIAASDKPVKPGDIILYNGVEARVAKNGALQDVATGKMIAPPADEYNRLQPVHTTAEAQALAHVRWHGKRQAAIVQAVQNRAPGNVASLVADIDDADGAVTQILVQDIVLNNFSNDKDRRETWEWVTEHSGMSGKAPKQAPVAVQAPGNILDVDALERTVAALEQARRMSNG